VARLWPEPAGRDRGLDLFWRKRARTDTVLRSALGVGGVTPGVTDGSPPDPPPSPANGTDRVDRIDIVAVGDGDLDVWLDVLADGNEIVTAEGRVISD
jgi:hypothetical protein